MKITRRQLRILLEQEAKKALTKDAIKQQIVKTVGDPESEGGEGGAAGFDPIVKAVEKLSDDEGAERPEDLDSDSELKTFIEDEIDNITLHKSGDYIETDGLNENIKSVRLTRGQLKKIIKEALADTDGDGALDPDEIRDIADSLEEKPPEPLRVWGIPYRDGFAYGGRRIISRDRAWLEFVPKGQEPDTKDDMFRSVELLEPDDPAVKKVIDSPRNSWYVRKYLKNATLDNFDVYSVYAHTTG